MSQSPAPRVYVATSRPSIASLLLLLGVAFWSASCGSRDGGLAPPPPPTEVVEHRYTMHGDELVDPYRWLEDQESPQTRSWIDAQNAYTWRLFGEHPRRRELADRLEELLRIERVSLPVQRRDRFFSWRKRGDDDLSVLYVRDGLRGEDRPLLDPHPWSLDHTTSATLLDVSADGTLLAYGVRVGGRDEVEVRFRRVSDGEDLADRLPAGLYRSLVIDRDDGGIFYGFRERGRGVRIYEHRFGVDGPDREIFGEGYGPGQWIFVDLSESGRFQLFYVGHGWATSDLFLLDRESAGGEIIALVRGKDARFEPSFAGETLVVQTNLEAPNGRVLKMDLAAGERTWSEIVPERSEAIREVTAAGGRIFVHYLRDVVSHIEMFDLDGNSLGPLQLPENGTLDGPTGSWGATSVFFDLQSFTRPVTLYRFDVDGAELEAWHEPRLPAGGAPFASDDYETRQVWYHSKDGTRVPMFLVHRRGLEPSGDQPTLLYGYGGFNVARTPTFNPLHAVWLEEGGLFALANIRGGGEFGEAWHRAGMLENKQNVFDDFIAAAEYLVAEGYTRPERLAIRGGSNGGLLVGASLTQRPELYRAVLCEYPDLDMVRYFEFPTNNPPALLEYGDASDPQQYRFLRTYSPYQAVRSGTRYPAVFLTTGDADTRVPPLQARKMTARLQAATSSGRPVVLWYDTAAGHSGGKPPDRVAEELSLELVFLFDQLNVE